MFTFRLKNDFLIKTLKKFQVFRPLLLVKKHLVSNISPDYLDGLSINKEFINITPTGVGKQSVTLHWMELLHFDNEIPILK